MRAIIFANGRIKNHTQVKSQLHPNDILIAADGGAEHCKDIGIKPHIVIGDMDSISPQLKEELESAETTFVTFPEDKDQTDLELALSFAHQKGANEIVLFGILGGRLDMSLANLLFLAKDEWRNLSIHVIDGPDMAFFLGEQDSITLEGVPGDIVSLIPLTAQVIGVSTQGLRWQLDDAVLLFGDTRSVSNEIMASPAEVKIEKGKLFIVHRTVIERGKEE